MNWFRTATTDIKKYPIRAVLQQVKNTWVCGQPCDPKLSKSESADTRIRENLGMETE